MKKIALALVMFVIAATTFAQNQTAPQTVASTTENAVKVKRHKQKQAKAEAQAQTPATASASTTAPSVKKVKGKKAKAETQPQGTASTENQANTVPVTTKKAKGKKAKAETQPQGTASIPSQTTSTPKAAKTKSVKTDAEKQAQASKDAARDKVIGQDKGGHDIHLGPKGGQYYINNNGEKTYLKSDNKLKVGK